eukprot:CAMPEP_0118928824 /NCGR_PEP_ID=MMETSP1169-20130426/5984_1 /TAXON_ID=36882 /ORGANISM="Pyramimonas obovata, Strain CCMP722" /LENGTH=669 /DNA_ID=CAMNT_0006870887 /DNA_START=178 /DNA_END=2187 /DNA_ORIENTATION=-
MRESQGSAVHLSVSFRRSSHAISLPATASLLDLGVLIEQVTGATVTTQKLLFVEPKGRPSPLKPDDKHTQDKPLLDCGLADGDRLTLIGSTQDEIQAVHAAESHDERLRGFDEELSRELKRRGRPVSTSGSNTKPEAPPYRPYSFSSYQTLNWPGINPPPSQALGLLYRIANDPGIVAIMENHRWNVGLLSEMPPEGKVGVSEVCLLGYNKNRGQEICLRLRTDDMKGFRKYDVIIKTVIHELVHMVHDDHDDAFKALNSQLTKEYKALNWTLADGRSQSEAAQYDHSAEWPLDERDPSDLMALTSRSSGLKLGGAPPPPPHQPEASEAAARAAMQRIGQPPAAPTRTNQPATPGGSPRLGGCACGAHAGVVGVGTVGSVCGGNLDGTSTAGTGAELATGEALTAGTVGSARTDALDGAEGATEMEWAADGGAPEAPKLPKVLPPQPEPTSPEVQPSPPEPELTKVPPSQPVAGTPEEESMAELQVAESERGGEGAEKARESPPGGGSPALQGGAVDCHEGMEVTAPSQSGTEGMEEMEGMEEFMAIQEAALAAGRKAEAALARVVGGAPLPAARAALQTVRQILANALERPHEPKFRRLRWANPAVARRVRDVSGAADVLRAAGFADEAGSDPGLCLRRDDPGLLWVVSNTVQTALTNVEEMAAPIST